MFDKMRLLLNFQEKGIVTIGGIDFAIGCIDPSQLAGPHNLARLGGWIQPVGFKCNHKDFGLDPFKDLIERFSSRDVKRIDCFGDIEIGIRGSNLLIKLSPRLWRYSSTSNPSLNL